MSDQKYNGWTNFETWKINLEICDDLIANQIGNQTFATIEDMVEDLTEEVDNVISNWGELDQDDRCSLALSYARDFVSAVNFYEIAQNAVEDNPELIAAAEEDEES